MLTTNLFLSLVKKNDIESILPEAYFKFTTVKEIIIPKEGNEEHYCIIYSNFPNPLMGPENKLLFSATMEMTYVAGENGSIFANFEIKESNNEDIILETDRLYILNGDEKILVDINKQKGVDNVEKFLNVLNTHVVKEFVFKFNMRLANIVITINNSLI